MEMIHYLKVAVEISIRTFSEFIDQNYSQLDACILATCLHGAAGEWCGNKYSHHATTISQLAKGIEKIFTNWEHNDFSQISDFSQI